MGTRIRNAKAFTLIELLVVIAIIALLIGILLPSLGAARESARTVVCQVNMRSINQSMVLYRNDFNEQICQVSNGGYRRFVDGTPINFWNPVYDAEPGSVDWAAWQNNTSVPYWGIPYQEYEASTEHWQDPSFYVMDPFPVVRFEIDFVQEVHRDTTYGINVVNRPSPDAVRSNNQDALKLGRWGLWTARLASASFTIDRRGGQVVQQTISGSNISRRQSEIPLPSGLIVFQDAYEHTVDGNGDTFDSLSQYDGDQGGPWRAIWRDEYFRHQNRGHAMMADNSLMSFDRKQVGEAGDPSLRKLYFGTPIDPAEYLANP